MERTYYDLPLIHGGGSSGAAGIARGAYGPAYREYFAYLADFTGGAALAAGTLNGLPSVQAFTDLPSGVVIQPDSDFEAVALTYVPTDPRVYARFRDNATGRYLQIGTLDLRDVCAQGAQGTSIGGAGAPSAQAFIPYILPQPYTFGARSTIGVSAADFSNATNTVRLAFHGNKIYAGQAPWLNPERVRHYTGSMPYFIPLPQLDSTSSAIAANASLVTTVTIDIDGDMLVEQVVGARIGSATVDIRDNSQHRAALSGQNDPWFSAPIHVDNFLGNALFPNWLPSPRFLMAGSTVTATITDLSAVANNVRLYLVGRKFLLGR